jgi:preprotein translocase subunit SecF
MSRLDLVGMRGWLFLGSGIVVVASLVLLAIPPALRPGIEFTSGTTALMRFESNVDQADLRDLYAELGHDEARVQSTGPREFLIRTSELEVPEGSFSEVAPEPEVIQPSFGPQPLEVLGTVLLGVEDQAATEEVLLRLPFGGDVCSLGDIAGRHAAGTEATVVEILDRCQSGDAGETVYRVRVGEELGYIAASITHQFTEPAPPEVEEVDRGERTVIENALRDRFGEFEVLEFASVSAVVSAVAVRNATIAVIVAAFFIMGYVMFAFSSLPQPFRYAACAIVALAHDVIIVLGAFSLLGKLFDIEINLMFVTGLLTVVGFSVHDSIVVFDRIRENITAAPDAPLAQNVNNALVQTLSRSLNTSVTLILTVLALLLLGGVTIQSFLIVILVGVIAGTYSSIGIAAQVLVAWEERDLGRPLSRRRARAEEPSTI